MKSFTFLTFLLGSSVLFAQKELIYFQKDQNLKIYWDTKEKEFSAYLYRYLMEPAYWTWKPTRDLMRGIANFVGTAQRLDSRVEDFSGFLTAHCRLMGFRVYE